MSVTGGGFLPGTGNGPFAPVTPISLTFSANPNQQLRQEVQLTENTANKAAQIAPQIAAHAKQIAADIKAARNAAKVKGAVTKLEYKSVPVALNAAWLEQSITGVGQDLTMQGAPQLQIDFKDTEQFTLLNSGLFESPTTGKDGALANIDINYPVGTKYWWRLFQMAPQADFIIQTYWIPRVVAELMDLHGPISANRAKVTRAEFIKSLCARVPEINFYSKQLDQQQAVANVKIPKASKSSGLSSGRHSNRMRLVVQGSGGTGSLFGSAGPKVVGLTPESIKGLTVKGSPMTWPQAQQANILLQVCDQLAAGDVVTTAIIFAGIWESGLSASPGNGSYWGCLSGSVKVWKQNDTAGMAKAFVQGGGGFSSALTWAKQSTNPAFVGSHAEGAIPYDANGISQQYESEGAWGTVGNATGAIKEAAAIVAAAGGSTGVGGVQGAPTETLAQYNFTIGTKSDPHEDFWTGINRLAQEVNWEIVVDGPDVYYDSDVTLTRGQPREVLFRTDPQVVDWSYDWDDRQVVTNFQLVLVCRETDYVPGEVFQLNGAEWGPCATGSTIGLPGRWLISEIQRNPGDIVSTLTLVQPTKPLKEPAATTKTGLTGSNVAGTVIAALSAAQRLSNFKIPYSQSHCTLTKRPQPGGYDCSASTSWILLTAGFSLPNNVTWDQWAPVSGDFETWGAPGPGDEMTVWCNADHVFIEFNVPNFGHYQANTSYPSSAGRNYGSGPYFFLWGPNGSTDAASGAFKARHWPGT